MVLRNRKDGRQRGRLVIIASVEEVKERDVSCDPLDRVP